MGFSRQEYWSLLFPSPVDPVLSELSTMTCPSWVAPHGMAHSFIELDKAVIHVISLVGFLWLWFLLWWIRIRGLWKRPDGRDWLGGKLGLVLMGGAMLSKSWIHFSFDGRGCVPSLLFGLRPTMVGVMRVMATSFRRTCAGTVVFSALTVPQAAVDPLLHPRLLDTHRQVWISFFLLAPGVHRFCLCLLRVCFPSPVEVLWSNRTGLRTSWEMPSWMKHKLESRLLGEISITSDMQMTPPLW